MSFSSVLAEIEKLENPYPGLRPFEPEDHERFFGRDEQIQELKARLERHRLVAVVGWSGSGKSSLVRAGLIPLMKDWRVVMMRPGDHPIQALAEKIATTEVAGKFLNASPLRESSFGLVEVARQLPPGDKLLLVVDQFEELFRFRESETAVDHAVAAEAADFVSLLLAAKASDEPQVYIVLTMRSDYLGDCAEFRGLPEALNDTQYLVPRMTREQRRQAIEGPLGPVEMEPSLVQRLLNDAGDEPDQLPLLQHALMRIWSHWRGAGEEAPERAIAVGDYENEKVGALGIALDRHASQLFSDPVAQARVMWTGRDAATLPTITEVIFRRLTAIGRGRRERRDPAPLSELWELCGAATEEDRAKVTAVVELFRCGEATFLTPRDGELKAGTQVDITHESLIRQWSELKGWAETEKREAKTLALLGERSRGAVLSGLDLDDALLWRGSSNPTAAWARHYGADLLAVARYIDRSQLEAKRHHARREWYLRLAVAVAVVLAGLLVFAIWSMKRAERLGNVALARQLASQADQILRSPDLHPAVLLSTESMRRVALVENDVTIRESAGLLPRERSRWVHKGAVYNVAFSKDGKYVATASDDGTARVFEAAGGKELAHLTHPKPVWAVAFSPNGRWVATGCEDHAARVFDAANGKEVSRLTHLGPVRAVAFSPDGRWVATGSLDNTARVFEAASGKEVSRLAHDGSVSAVAFSPDGRWVATGSSWQYYWRIPSDKTYFAGKADWDSDNTGRVFEAASGKEVSRLVHQGSVGAVAFSPDGRWVATGSLDNKARVFDAASGKEASRLVHQGSVVAVAFSPDGRLVATGSADNTARVFEAANGKEVSRLAHQASVEAVAFSPDGKHVGTGSSDNTARVFEAASGKEVSRMAHEERVTAVRFSPDGRQILTGSFDKTARLFEATSGNEVSRLGYQGSVWAVAFSPDGHQVAIASDEIARVLEAATGKEMLRQTHQVPVTAVAFSPDGRWMVTGSNDKTARVFEVASGKEVSYLAQAEPVRAVAFSPDGRRIATGSNDVMLRVFDIVNGKEVSYLTQSSYVSAVAFSPDARFIAIGSGDHTARVFESATGKELSRLAHQGLVLGVAFSPDGHWVATGSDDKTARVFEAATGKELARMTLDGPVSAIVFSPDGRYLTTASGAAKTPEIVITRNLLRPQDLIDDACSRVTRNLTRAEWKQYLPDVRYRQTCPNLPPGK